VTSRTKVDRHFLNATANPGHIVLRLIPYQHYSRQDVHDIFSPDSTFTPQAGTWGLQGIVQIPGRDSDFVFFVTFGQKQADHVFDEGITPDGVLTWQSQPKRALSDRQIQQFIKHNEDVNSIYLFLRTSQGKGSVYFQWQILDWNIPKTIGRNGLEVRT
jgi:hypothetical protein